MNRQKRMSSDQLKNQIRIMLSEGRKTWRDLEKAIGRATSLSKAIKELIESGEIFPEQDPEDRRVTWYELVEEKAEPHIKCYEITTFLKNLKDSICIEVPISIENYTATCNLLVEDLKNKDLDLVVFEKELGEAIQPLKTLLVDIKAKKIALVLTVEEK